MSRLRKLSSAKLGVIALVASIVIALALFSKDRIATTLMPGETITVHLAGDYKLRPFVSQVKVGFVPVGRVNGVEVADDGTAIVSLKVDEDALDKLGSEPSAVIRPTTVLGGSYFVDLQAGGDEGPFTAGSIPIERTASPVELDKVVGTLQPDALQGMQATLGNLESALDADGQAALERLMRSSSRTLPPTTRMLEALQGTRPAYDLGAVVQGLEGTSRALTSREGRLDNIVVALEKLTGVLDRRSGDLAEATRQMPETLDNARIGLRRLEGTLETLEDVSSQTRPVARELRSTLEKLDPVLVKARPVIRDLRVVVADARPLLADLVPTAHSTRDVLGDLRGPVLDRVDGPVMEFLNADYNGTAKYKDSHSSHPMYEETALALANVTRATSMVDRNGHAIAFQPGVGGATVSGMPISLEQYVKLMSTWMYVGESGGPSLNRARNDSAVTDTVNGLLSMVLGGGN